MRGNRFAEWALSLIFDAIKQSLTGSLTFHFHGGKIRHMERKECVKPEETPL